MSGRVVERRGATPGGGAATVSGVRRGFELRRFAVLVLAVGAAAPLTFDTYLSDWRYQSPLAELAFVPLVGLVLLAATAIRFPYVRSAKLALVDWLLAVPAVGAVAAAEAWDLVQPGSYIWVLRLDALTIPLVAFAAVVLLYGVRSLAAFYPSLVFLWLAWPLPVAALLELVTGPVTELTGRSVQQLLVFLPFAEVVDRPAADLVVDVATPGQHLLVQVSSACSGIGGLLGFAVVGGGLLCLHEGRLRNKLGWLAAGLLLIFASNVLRIIALVLVAATLGEAAAMDVFHPVAGMVLLNLGVWVMWVSAERFGLRRRPLRPQPTDNPLHATTEKQPGREGKLLVRVAALLVVACSLGLLNAQYAGAAPAYRNESIAQVRPLSQQLDTDQAFGYQVASLGEESWSRRYFGEDSRWTRFELTSADQPAPTVWVDVIDANALGALRAHSTLDCYKLHSQDVVSRKRVTLPSGVNVDVYAVHMQGGLWHVVTWERPIHRGDRVAHERVTLTASSLGQDFNRELLADERPGLRGRLLAGVNALRPGSDPNPALSRNLLSLADDIERTQLASHAPTALEG